MAEAELDHYAQAGTVAPETFVWAEGMADWMPYCQARPAAVVRPPPAPPPPVVRQPALHIAGHATHLPDAAPAAEAESAEAVCSGCGAVLPAESVIPIADKLVCARCKPIFLQRVREGVPLGAPLPEYIEPLTRFGVSILDGLLLWLGVLPAGIPPAIAAGFHNQRGEGHWGIMLGGIALAMIYVLWWMYHYHVGRIYKYGATWGMGLCKMKITTVGGGPLSFGKALGRLLMLVIILNTPLVFGQVVCFFHPQKRTLLDLICGTCVVKAR